MGFALQAPILVAAHLGPATLTTKHLLCAFPVEVLSVGEATACIGGQHPRYYQAMTRTT